MQSEISTPRSININGPAGIVIKATQNLDGSVRMEFPQGHSVVNFPPGISRQLGYWLLGMNIETNDDSETYREGSSD